MAPSHPPLSLFLVRCWWVGTPFTFFLNLWAWRWELGISHSRCMNLKLFPVEWWKDTQYCIHVTCILDSSSKLWGVCNYLHFTNRKLRLWKIEQYAWDLNQNCLAQNSFSINCTWSLKWELQFLFCLCLVVVYVKWHLWYESALNNMKYHKSIL